MILWVFSRKFFIYLSFYHFTLSLNFFFSSGNKHWFSINLFILNLTLCFLMRHQKNSRLSRGQKVKWETWPPEFVESIFRVHGKTSRQMKFKSSEWGSLFYVMQFSIYVIPFTVAAYRTFSTTWAYQISAKPKRMKMFYQREHEGIAVQRLSNQPKFYYEFMAKVMVKMH